MFLKRPKGKKMEIIIKLGPLQEMYLQSAVYEARDNYTMGHMDFEAKLRIKHIEL